jgi:ectoine hydroxylase-related dioxygenase (phytanoyl-CoA dioxygenase family)
MDSLPPLTERVALPAATIEAFRKDGHVKIAGAFTAAEIEAYRPHLNRAIDDAMRDERLIAERVVDVGRGWKFVKNVWSLTEVTRRFIASARLGSIAAALLGVPAVRLFRDQSYYKMPGGGCTPWHQDSSFIPLDAESLSIWIPLTRVTPDMAPMDYATGSHRIGTFFGTSGAGDEEMDAFENGLRAKGFAIANYDSFDVGDVAAHYTATMHGSRANRSHVQREVLVAAYFPDGTRVGGNVPVAADASPAEQYVNTVRAENREMVMAGLAPGDLAAGPDLPLVYREPAQA